MSIIAGLVLAAGSGRRLGTPKALLRYQDAPLVERAVWTLHEGGCAPVVVVLGAAADRVAGVADLSKASVVVNKAWGTGMGSSLRAGLEAVAATDVDAVTVLPVDMPRVGAEAVSRVCALSHRDALVCATYGGRRDHPVLVGRGHWSGVTTLANADVGLRPYLLARAAQITEVACDQVAAGDDVDTLEDAERLGIVVPG